MALYSFTQIRPPGEQFFFLKNMIGVFADEIDTTGNDVTKVWELK
jgi:hypothetical protein